MISEKFVTNTTSQTQNLGKDFAAKLNGRAVFALYGNLGSGKTTFVQGLAKGLGVKQRIISPTFIIVRKYNMPSYSSSKALAKSRSNSSRHLPAMQDNALQAGARTISFYHIDLYRVEGEIDVEALGIKEILNNPENIVAIEWPEKIEKMLPKTTVKIKFEYIENDKRQIKII